MWPFKKRLSLKESGIFEGFIDWHSHILPGVDDGVRTMDEALGILCYYEQLGVKTVWLTPHIMEDIPNSTAELRECFTELQAAYKGPVELNLAAENMLDNLFMERLERNDLLPIGNRGNHLLVETSYFNPPMDLQGTLRSIMAKGYYPVLAHPERYVYMETNDYRQLRDLGVIFQLNLLSLVGVYGSRAKHNAEWLLKNKIYDISGTDIHRSDYIDNYICQPIPQKSIISLSYYGNEL